MMEWIKSKAILVLGILVLLLVASNTVTAVLLMKGGIHVTRNEYITTNSRSDSYSSSGSLSYVLNFIGMQKQELQQGEFKDKDKRFDNYEDALKFYKQLGFGEKRMAHIFGYKDGIYIWYSDFSAVYNSALGNTVTTKTEKTGIRER